MEQQSLSNAPVGKLMAKYAVPCVISLLVGALYNIVDQLFVHLIPGDPAQGIQCFLQLHGRRVHVLPRFAGTHR